MIAEDSSHLRERRRIGSLHGASEIWNRWDAVHYLSLAQHDYGEQGEDRILFVQGRRTF